MKFKCIKREGQVCAFGKAYRYGDSAYFTPAQVLSESFISVRIHFKRIFELPANQVAMKIEAEAKEIEIYDIPESKLMASETINDSEVLKEEKLSDNPATMITEQESEQKSTEEDVKPKKGRKTKKTDKEKEI